MENIKDKIDQGIIDSLKNGPQEKLGTLRMLKAGIKNKEIELKRELKAEEMTDLLRYQIKIRKEASEQFGNANRQDLRAKEEKEILVIQEFLPPKIATEELEELVKEAIEEAEAVSVKDLGKVMSLAIKRVKGRAGGQEIKDIVLKILQ